MSKELLYQLAVMRLGKHLADQQLSDEKAGHFYLNHSQHKIFGQALAVIFEKREEETGTELEEEYSRRYKKALRENATLIPYDATIRVLHLDPNAGMVPIEHSNHITHKKYHQAIEGSVEAARNLLDKGYYLEVADLYIESSSRTEPELMHMAVDITQLGTTATRDGDKKHTFKDVVVRYRTPFARETKVGDILIWEDKNRRSTYLLGATTTDDPVYVFSRIENVVYGESHE